MCVAIVKESGVSLPTKKVLKQCFSLNPDGAGYASLQENETWHCKKGFMSFKKFWKSFKEEGFSEEDHLLIHFRIGTSGKKAHPDCTHPFPISDSTKDLTAHSFESKTIAMHNGVCGFGRGVLSDSMVAIADYAFVLYPYLDKDPKIMGILHELMNDSNRWYLAVGLSTYMMGDWIQDEDTKIWYSNTDYLPKSYHEATWWNTYGDTGGHWWNAYQENMALPTPLPKTKEEKEDIKESKDIYEVYDIKGETVALVDNHGEVVWGDESKDDKGYERLDRDFDCTVCGNTVSLAVLTVEGECPFCYESLIPIGMEYECPNCGEDNYLIEPAEDEDQFADTQCVTCGALFMDNTRVIIGWANNGKKAMKGGV